MRRFAILAAVAAAACGVLAGPTGPAWAEESAQDTINRLQKEGYTVTLDKIGTGPMSKCVVTSVRRRTVPAAPMGSTSRSTEKPRSLRRRRRDRIARRSVRTVSNPG